MNIFWGDQFKKQFGKLPKKIQQRFENRIGIFVEDSTDPSLKIHPLKGQLAGLRAFSVTGDYRVIYKIIDKDSIKLINIGTHNQVY